MMPGHAAGNSGPHRYARPRLRLDDAFVDEETGKVAVVVADEVFDLDIDGVDPALMIEQLLALHDPSALVWSDRATAPPWAQELIVALDGMGLVDDLADGAEVVDADLNRISAAVADTASWLRRQLPAQGCRRGYEAFMVADATDDRLGDLPLVADPDGSVNFPLTTLALQARYWAHSAHLARASVLWLLAETADGAPSDPARCRQAVKELAGGEDDTGYAVDAIYCAAALVNLAARDDAARMAHPHFDEEPERMSGSAHILRAERAARRAAADLGTGLHVEILEAGRQPHSFVQGVFAEQHYVTGRFVEAIAPAMTARLRPELRGRVFRYYHEEFGHEAMERASCLALGVTDRQLERYLSLPYFMAFIDGYTAVSQSDSLSFMTSVMVTEGLPGDPFGINNLLGPPEQYGEDFAKLFRDHEVVNDDVDHALLARAMLADVPSVTAERHRRSCDTLVFLLELCERAWRLLMEFHTVGAAAGCLPPAYHDRSALARG